MRQQTYIKRQAECCARNAKVNTGLTIFVLNSYLTLLQFSYQEKRKKGGLSVKNKKDPLNPIRIQLPSI